jgi:hypothetical protein
VERAPGTHWVGEESGWAPEPVWTTWRGENSCPYRDSNSDPSAVQPVASRYADYAIPYGVSDFHCSEDSGCSLRSYDTVCVVTNILEEFTASTLRVDVGNHLPTRLHGAVTQNATLQICSQLPSIISVGYATNAGPDDLETSRPTELELF